MQILITIIDFSILGLLLAFPALLLSTLKRLKSKRPLIVYSIFSLFGLGILVIISAWWSYKSDLILLKYYGYNIDGMNHAEFYEKVSPDNMEKVKGLETSIMGIGWPLKAFFGFFMFIPYLIIVYTVKVFIDRLKSSKNDA